MHPRKGFAATETLCKWGFPKFGVPSWGPEGNYRVDIGILEGLGIGVSSNSGYLRGGPHNKDYIILGGYIKVPLVGVTTKYLSSFMS